MPYIINKFDGLQIAVVEDGTINSTVDLKLVGKDYPGYGEIQNENFVFLLENFAGASAPPKAMNGQLWYDTVSRKIKFYDKVGLKWRATGSAEVSTTAPTGLAVGDFWWDSTESKLYIKSGTDYTLIGPQSVYQKGITQMRSRKVADGANNQYAIIEAYVNGVIENIIASDTFTLHASYITEYQNRFTVIRKGLNLPFTDSNGVTTDYSSAPVRYWGTASDSARLGGRLPSDYVLAGEAHFPDAGFTVGDDNDLRVFINNGTIPTIINQVGNQIQFYVRYLNSNFNILNLADNSLLPGTSLGTNIGHPTWKFNTVYAASFNGIATNADLLKVGTSYFAGSVSASGNTIAARDASGNLTANVFNGVATSARYADLAEKYIPDADYEVGTVMMVGGEQEVTQCESESRAIGVISGNPAYMMNCDLEGGVYVALKGRVPVKVFGKVKKGDKLIAWNNGVAISSVSSVNTFAIALESNDSSEIKLIEAVIL